MRVLSRAKDWLERKASSIGWSQRETYDEGYEHDDGHGDYGDYEEREREERTSYDPHDGRPFSHMYTPKKRDYGFASDDVPRDKVRHIDSANMQPKIFNAKPHSIDECSDISDRFRAGFACVISLNGIERESAQGVVHFLSGLVSGLEGSIKAVSGRTFVIAPKHWEIESGIGSEGDEFADFVDGFSLKFKTKRL